MRIHIEITGRCNLRCTYCYNSCFNKKEILNKEVKPFEWKKIIDEANKIGCERFTISGGEPLLVEEIFDLIERCKEGLVRSKIINHKEEVEEALVLKIPFTYPIYSLSYMDNLRPTIEFLEQNKKLKLLGRIGRFSYSNMDDVVYDGFELAKQIID